MSTTVEEIKKAILDANPAYPDVLVTDVMHTANALLATNHEDGYPERHYEAYREIMLGMNATPFHVTVNDVEGLLIELVSSIPQKSKVKFPKKDVYRATALTAIAVAYAECNIDDPQEHSRWSDEYYQMAWRNRQIPTLAFGLINPSSDASLRMAITIEDEAVATLDRKAFTMVTPRGVRAAKAKDVIINGEYVTLNFKYSIVAQKLKDDEATKDMFNLGETV